MNSITQGITICRSITLSSRTHFRLISTLSSLSNQKNLTITRKPWTTPHCNTVPSYRGIRSLGKVQGRVMILGSGWAGFKLIREMDKHKYQIVSVSPRNHFVFTPLLASTKEARRKNQVLNGRTNIWWNGVAKESGTFAWIFWRSSYLTMSVSLRNKMLIPMYWFMTWVFGRDVSSFQDYDRQKRPAGKDKSQ